MKRVTRVVGWTVALLLVIGLVAVALRPQPVLVDVAVVSDGPMQVTVDDDGVTRIKERYIVSTPLAGRLERIALEVGDSVTADTTVIANMQPTDPSLLDPRAAAQARARVRAAERRLEAAQVELTKAESSREFAQAELKRTTDLAGSAALSLSEREARELAFRLRSEESKAAQFGVDIAEYELELEKAALLLTDPEQTPEGSPGDTSMQLEIKAPIDGRVLRIDQESTAVLNAGASIMELGDPSDLEVVADVLSVEAVKIKPGDQVQLVNWGGEEELRGEVRVIEPSGFTKLSALGVEEQRVNVVIDFLNAHNDRQQLGDGFRIDVRVVIWQSEKTLKIPTSALFRVGEEWGVFVKSGAGLAEQRIVKIGQNNGVEAQVLEGLNAGQTVIVHPSDSLDDGSSVEVRSP